MIRYLFYILLFLGAHSLRAQTFSEVSVAGLPDLTNSEAKWADLDNNGTLDLIVGGQTILGSDFFSIFFNNGDETFTASSGGIQTLTGPRFAVADIDHDGFGDIAIQGNDLTGDPVTTIYKNNQDGTFSDINAGFIALSGGDISLADLDNDGDADLLYSGLDGSNDRQTLTYQNSTGEFEIVANDFIGLANGEVAIHDFNRDGRADVFVSGVANSSVRFARLYFNRGDWQFELSGNSFTGSSFNRLTVNDFDLNGFLDIAITGIAATGFVSEYFLNTGGVFSNTDIGLTPLATSQIASGDFNGDGFAGLLIGGLQSNGLLTSSYFRSETVGVFDERTSPIDNISNGVYAVADFNGDGFTDVFFSGSTEVDLSSTLLENDTTHLLTAVEIPSNLEETVNEDTVILQWDAVANIPSYNLTVRNITLDSLIVSPLVNTTTGFNRLAEHGIINANTIALNGLPEGNYEWSAQAIDVNFRGSQFSTSETFQICLSFDLGEDVSTCFDEPVTFNAGTSDDVVNWFSKLNGLLLANSNEYIFPGQETDTLIVEINRPFGCVVRDTLIATVIPLPAISLGVDTAVCIGEELTLNVPDFGINLPDVEVIDSANWFNVDGDLLLANSSSFTFEVLADQMIVAQVFNSSRCINYDTIAVSALPLPSFSLGTDTTFCFEEDLTLSVIGFPSDEIDSVNWFTDTGTSLLSNAGTFTFSVIQDSIIVAEVFNTNRCVNYDTIEVAVLSLPNFSIGADTAICFGEELTLTVPEFQVSPDVDSVNWFNVAGEELLRNSATITIEILNEETVVAEVFNTNRCVNYDTIEVAVLALPSFFIGADTAICFGEELTLEVPGFGTGDEVDSVNWFDVDGTVLVSNASSFTFEVLEEERIVAEVFNVNRCVNYDTIDVSVLSLPSFTIGPDTAICEGEEVTFSVPGFGSTDDVDSVNWFNGTGDILLTNSDVFTLEVLAEETIVAQVFNVNRCVNYDTLEVDVLSLPDFTIGADTLICLGEELTLTVPGFGLSDELDSVNWFSNEGEALLTNSEVFTFEVSEEQMIVAEVFNANRCMNYDTIVVGTLPLPDFTIGEDRSVCFGEEVMLEVPGFGSLVIDSVNWFSVSGESLLTNSGSFTFTVETDATIVAEVFNASRCVNYDTLTVNVLDLPEFTIGDDMSLCFGEELTLSIDPVDIGGGASEVDSVNWLNLSGEALLTNAASFTFEVLTDQTIVAQVFNVARCVNYDTVSVEALALPEFSIGADTAICFGEELTLEVPTFGISNVGQSVIDSVNWFEEDGTLLLANSATFTFEVLTDRNIVAEVFNEAGCINFDTLNVSVFELPQFDLGADQAHCFGTEILLQTSPTFAETNWQLLDGTVLQENSFFYNHLVQTTDTIVVQFFNGNGCVNYDTLIVRSNPLPEISLGEDIVICAGEEVSFDLNGFEEVAWFSENDGLIANSGSVAIPFFESDRLIAEVTNELGCMNTDTVTVTVNPLPVLTLPTDTAICIGSTLTLDTGMDFEQISWTTLSNGTVVGQEQQLDFEVLIDDQIVLRAINSNGCESTDTITIAAMALPTFSIGDDINVCSGMSVTLSATGELSTIDWFSENEGLISSGTFSFEYETLVSDQITAVGFTEFGCETTLQQTITVLSLPEVFAGNDTLACGGLELLLGSDLNDPSNSYSWSPTTFLDDPSLARPTTTPSENITYQVTVTDENGCESQDEIVIEVNPDNVIDAGGNTAICIGDEIVLGGDPTASGSAFAYRYEWSPAEFLQGADMPNPVAAPEETTTYRLLVFTGECMVDTVFTTLEVNDLPEVEIIGDTTIGFGESIQLFATGGTAYSWTPITGLTGSDQPDPFVSDLQTEITYEVLVTDENGCRETASVNVFVRNQLFIPNLFTPNGDGANDVFLLYADGIETLTWRISDINGNLVYETQDPQEALEVGWDGTNNGEELPDGNYLWAIQGTYFNGDPLQFNGQTKGIIRLVR